MALSEKMKQAIFMKAYVDAKAGKPNPFRASTPAPSSPSIPPKPVSTTK